jgi:glyoxylase I family protein
MVVSFVFAGVAVADFAAAYEWYVRLLGRGADMFPHERESVWRLTPSGSIYVVEDRERAGSSLVTLALDDLDACERRLRDGEFSFSEEIDGGAPRRLVVRDHHGNTLTFSKIPHLRTHEPWPGPVFRNDP